MIDLAGMLDEVERLRAALVQLVYLKDTAKTKFPEEYALRKESAWDMARDALKEQS